MAKCYLAMFIQTRIHRACVLMIVMVVSLCAAPLEAGQKIEQQIATTLTTDIVAGLGALVPYVDASIATYFPSLSVLLYRLSYPTQELSHELVFHGVVDALAFIAKNQSIKEPLRSRMVSTFTDYLQCRAALNSSLTRVVPSATVPASSFERSGANTSLGTHALRLLKKADSIGIANTAVGENALRRTTYGSNNIAVGHNAGAELAIGDNNIYVGHAGLAKESGVTRIGTPDMQKQCHIAGNLFLENGLVLVEPLDVFNAAHMHNDLTVNGSVHIVGTLDLNGSGTFGQNIYLPATTSAEKGVLYFGGTRMHCHGYDNLFWGAGAGNFSGTGNTNHSMGQGTLGSLTTGEGNSAIGYLALAANTKGSENIAIGTQVLYSNISGDGNIAMCFDVLVSNQTGSANCALGYSAQYSNTTGSNNCAIGSGSLASNRVGSKNIALGESALYSLQGGENNIGIGCSNFGGSFIVTGSNNICMGNSGRAEDSGLMRFGTTLTHTSCFISGVRDVVPSGLDTLPVVIDAHGQLGSIAPSSAVWKYDIASASKKADQLNALNPVSFKYKGDASGKTHFGLVAEEVADVFPELAIRNKQGEVVSVAYHELAPLLLAAHQEEKKSVTRKMQDILDRLAQVEDALKKKLQK